MRTGGKDARSRGFHAATGVTLLGLVAGSAQAASDDDFMRCIIPDVSRPDHVIASCSKSINSKNRDKEARAMAYLSRGNMYRRKRQYDRALADYNESLRLYPNSAPTHTSRGNAWRGKHDLDRALTDHNEAIKLDPNYAEAYSNRGNVYSDKNDYDRAIANYDKAIVLKPNYPVAFFNRGLAWKAKGDHARSIADYRQALKLDPNFKEVTDALKSLGERP